MTCASAPVCGPRCTAGPCGAGWSTRTSERPPVSSSSRSSRGWGGARRRPWSSWRNGPRGVGPARTSFFLRIASPASHRALPLPPRPRRSPAASAIRRAALPPMGPGARAPGVTVVRDAPPTDLIELVLSVIGDPAVRARGGTVLVLVPSVRVGGAAHRTAGPAGACHRGDVGAGARPAGRSSSGAAPARGPPSRGWPPPSSSTRTTPPTGRRARPPTVPWTSCIERSPSRRGSVHRSPPRSRPCRWRRGRGCGHWRPRRRRSGPDGPPSSGSIGGVPTRAPACSPRSSFAWPGPCWMSRPRPNGALWSASTTAPAAPALLACRHCGELARCARCGAAAAQPPGRAGALRCPRCGETRPVVCAACGRLRMKTLRVGVSRLREELAALLGVEVGEVAGPRRGRRRVPAAGTRRSSWGPRRCCTACAVPPRSPFSTSTCTCSRRGSRRPRRPWRCSSGPPGSSPARGRGRHGRDCRPRRGCPITRCSRRSPGANPTWCSPKRWRSVARRRCPPFAALALVSGTLAPAYADGLAPEVEARRPPSSRRWPCRSRLWARTGFSLRADSHQVLLCDLLARTPRPPGRGLRVEVDPAYALSTFAIAL